jgi:hypothetical protein
MMLCNPNEPTDGSSTGDTSSFAALTGHMYIFSTTGNTGGYSPGVFNLVDPPSGNGDAAVAAWLSQQTLGACSTAGTNPAQGQKTSATKNGINVRFDQPPSGNTTGFDVTPAPIVIDGINTYVQGNSCHTNSVTPTSPNFDPTNYSTTCTSSGSCPLPWDQSFTSVGGSGGSQIGAGVSTTDLQTYWTNQHNATLPTGVTTRYGAYQCELGVGPFNGVAGCPPTQLSNSNESASPACNVAGEIASEYNYTRRIISIAVVDCLYWGVQGNRVNDIPINTYADFFLTNSVPSSGPNNGNIYTEYVGKHNIGEFGGGLYRIVHLVR